MSVALVAPSRRDDGRIVDGSDWLDNDVETPKMSAYPGRPEGGQNGGFAVLRRKRHKPKFRCAAEGDSE